MAARGAAAMMVEGHCVVQGEQELLRLEPCWTERQRVPVQPNEVLAQEQVQQQLAEAPRQPAVMQLAQLVPPSLAQQALAQALPEQVLALEPEQQQAQPPASGPAG
jgi:hypothetical protein